ncbi:MAG: flagellar type III secretion system pore protein FliP [Oscillospiraceae bacterium]
MEEQTLKKKIHKKNLLRLALSLAVFVVLLFATAVTASAAKIDVGIDSGTADDPTSALDLLFLLAMIAVIPSLILVMTSFTRIIISLSFLRTAIGTQTTPPNQVLVGLALFMTLFIMFPVITDIKEQAYDPLQNGTITTTQAISNASVPIKQFMLKQVYDKDLDMFLSLAQDKGVVGETDIQNNEDLTNLSLTVIVPAFITSELKRAFLIGFLLYIPFLIIDIVVSSTLMSMGMVMLPPTMIALPFKLMLFVLVDGWNLLIEALVAGFH